MGFRDVVTLCRRWIPYPFGKSGIEFRRWLLIEGNRLVVTVLLSLLVFGFTLGLGIVWPIEIEALLTETDTVENVLIALLSGIILLVSIVVSINSISLSFDISSIGAQQEQIEAVMDFRREIGRLTDADKRPSDPSTFIASMAVLLENRAACLPERMEGHTQAFRSDVEATVEELIADVDGIAATDLDEGELPFLWKGLEFEYGKHIDNIRMLQDTYPDEIDESFQGDLEELITALKLFATGREYFKTLFYNEEVSRLSRTLLIVSLPAILVTAGATLAIGQVLLPTGWIGGLPPRLTFIAIVLTIALVPFIVLTAYMLRITTVAIRTATGGPFWLKQQSRN